MVEFDKADLDSNGSIDRHEWRELALEDKRREMIDEDLKRNTERMLVVWCCIGMLIYPFIILLASVLGFDKAASLITDIASVYVIAASGVICGFIGFNSMSAKKPKPSTSYDRGEDK
tara:strand:+ start:105 stop:455 length:351 start_codon:yes stop_codon:yes gene_type:complete